MINQTIIEGCKKEDAKSQRLLFDAFAPKMFVVCQRYARHNMEAEDMLQDAFVKVFDHIGQFNATGSIEGWVRKIVVNTALNYCKKISFTHENIGLPAHYDVPEIASVLAHLSEEELLRHVRALPDGFRIVFNLYAIEGFDHKEIAAQLNIQEGTSRSQLARARQLLQQKIFAASEDYAYFKTEK
jgi:RNA polymerase sigma factor (sigma-70 family)